MKKIALLSMLFLPGCIGPHYKYGINFVQDSVRGYESARPGISGRIEGRGTQIGEFKKILEALSYRTEK